jgi:flagellar M-ring protein FliF
MNLPTPINDIADRSRAWWSGANQTQRGLVVGLAAAVVLALAMVIFTSTGKDDKNWEGAILYADLDYQEAADVSRRLTEMQVRHRLTNDASAILVPADEVRDLRLRLAGEGYPKTGRMGYDIFKDAQLTMTDFLQKVNFQRALQEELEKTLERIDGVRSARVHLVIPAPSLFSETQNPTTASVSLTLANNARLKRERVDAIVNLVSASVEGLEPANVVVLDQSGNMLSEEKDPLVKVANKQFEMQQQVERALEQKVQSLMDQVIAKDRSRVRINCTLDFSQRQTQSNTVDPGETQVVVSEETNEKNSAEQGTDEQTIRNYEVNRTVQNIVGAVGRIERMSMALTIDETKVVVDPNNPNEYIEEKRTDQEIEHLKQLAMNAVGFDDKRGDQITIFAMPFEKTEELQAKKAAEAEQRKEFWTGIAVTVAKILGIVAALVTLRFIIQAIGRGVGVEEELEVLGEVQPDVAEESFERPDTPHDIILARVQQMVRDRPEDAAKLIKTMLLEEKV